MSHQDFIDILFQFSKKFHFATLSEKWQSMLINEDLGNGLEKVKVRVVNDVNEETIPTDFEYIAVTEIVPLDLLDNKPPTSTSKGHKMTAAEEHYKVRTDFKEISKKFEVFYTISKGWCLRALEDIKPGTDLFEYVGEFKEEGQFSNRDYFFGLEFGRNYHKEYVIDARLRGNLARFVSHSCQPNCKAAIYGHKDGRPNPTILISSKVRIEKGEEITIDYGEKWWVPKAKTGSIKGCLCMSTDCKYDERWCARVAAEYGASDGNKTEAKKGEPEKMEPEKVETEKMEPEKSKPEMKEPEKVEPKKVETEKSKTEMQELEKVETEKVEPEKSKPEMEELEKVETEKMKPEKAEADDEDGQEPEKKMKLAEHEEKP